MSRSQQNPSEPEEPERHYVGEQEPEIEFQVDEGLSYSTDQEALLADGDFTNVDDGF